jgi:4-amino-4-deoxy-L-arabinose transferase-like glycosyltransferase
MGLAFLAKGPVGVVLPVFMMAAGRAVSGRRVLPDLGSLLTAVVAVCAVVAPWGLAFVSRVGLSTALGTVRHEALDRFLTGHDHPAPLFYFVAIAFPGFGPWIAMSIVAAGRALRRPTDPGSRTAAYACGAWITGLVFFSIGRGKLPSYILPLSPFVAIATSWAIGQAMASRRRRVFEPMMMAGVLTLMALGLSVVLATGRWPELRGVTASGASVFGVGALVAWIGALKKQLRLVFVSVAIASFAFLLVTTWIAFPLLGESRSCRSAVRTVPGLSSGRPIVIFEQRIPSLTFYADVIPEWIAPAGLAERLDRGDCPFIVFRNKDLARIPSEALARVREVGRTEQFVVAECRHGA